MTREVRIENDLPYRDEQGYRSSDNFLEDFKTNFKIEIQHMSEDELVFDLVGVDASIANALRRILLAEIPTMAIEHVYIWKNSSIIQDEVLAHRMGLVPIQVDPRMFDSFPEFEEGEPTDQNTLVFKLDIECKYNPEHPNDLSKAEHTSVYSSDLVWVPQGSQGEKFDNIRPVHEDILIAKLRPGQSIALEAHCRKGVGKDHAKFSPVCTASYRLVPNIYFPEEIIGDDAEALKAKCPLNVFDIEDIGKQKKATVARPRDCTMCRECIREPGWDQKVKLRRHIDRFIFSVESVGMLSPQDLLNEAFRVLSEKCDTILESLSDMEQPTMEIP